MNRTRTLRDPEARFWSFVEPVPWCGCWIWMGGRTMGGYGTFWLNGASVSAHRYAYSLAKGEMPEGTETDHLCRNRGCVNPDHLEAVTPTENNHRSVDNAWMKQKAKTHCPQGHPYIEDNIIHYKTARYCWTCVQQYKRNWRSKRRAAGLPVI